MLIGNVHASRSKKMLESRNITSIGRSRQRVFVLSGSKGENREVEEGHLSVLIRLSKEQHVCGDKS